VSTKLHGVIPVIQTPFFDDETIDEASLRKVVDFAIECGAGAVCIPGYASEFYKLSDPERYRVSEVVVEQTKGRVPVIISTGSGSVYSTIKFSQYAESIGAQALMVLPPSVAPLGPKEIFAFFESVCRSVRIPIMLQDADFTGSGLPVRLFVDLAERCPNFCFAKVETALPGTKCEEIIRLSKGKIQVLYGLGGVYLMDGFRHGASAVMPGAGFTDLYAHIFELHDAGQDETARTLFYRMMPYLVFARQNLELNMILEKRVLVRRGVIPSDRLREPTLHLSEAHQKEADEIIDLVLKACRDAASLKKESLKNSASAKIG
jgi:4-hydroxy-tetrahydrodipicolinate synthase